LRPAAPGEIPEDGVEPGVVYALYVPTSIEVAWMFLVCDSLSSTLFFNAARFTLNGKEIRPPVPLGVTDLFNPALPVAELSGNKAAVQVNQSATGFPQLLASLPKSSQHPMTARIEAQPILEFPPRSEMHSGRKVGVR